MSPRSNAIRDCSNVAASPPRECEMSRRVVMLGLDSMDRMLVQQWVAEGRLPVMGELLADSHKLMLDEANRPLPGGVWTDIATGASAAHHGYIHQQALRLGSYEWRYV